MLYQYIIGIVMMMIGIIVLIHGIKASQSVVDHVSDSFTGQFTETTTWYLIGGTTSGLLGLLLVTIGNRL